jgi:leucyl aminopeptidase
LPVDIDVTPHLAAVDDVLTSPGAVGDVTLIAVPVRRPQVRAASRGAAADDPVTDHPDHADPDGSDPGADPAGGGPDADPAGSGPDGDPSWADITGTGTTALAGALGLTVAEALTAYGLTGKPGEVVRAAARTPDGVVRLILLGVGEGTAADLRRAGAALARQVEAGATALAALPDEADPDPFVAGVLLGGYKFSLPARDDRDDRDDQDDEDAEAEPRARLVRLLTRAEPAPGRRPATIAAAVALARDLVNMPSDIKTPAWLAEQAAAAAARSGLQIRVRDETELAAEGFGGILAVGAGSVRPPRMIELSYDPGGARDHVVLIGKGITFDSGGLSLKPNEAMKTMKGDMAGGAAVIAALSALAALEAPVRVTGLIGAAENLPSGSAMRPGDVITSYGGRTIEVLNTDAEGRLVLADLLGYAATVDPAAIVDLATLTGSVRVALGGQIGALYASDDELAADLRAAGAATGERLWRMPLPEDYTTALTSNTADLAHVASAMNGARNAQAGGIVAALFLREFTGGRRWAHLDIAGPARSASDDGELTRGGTGFGTRLLLHWLAPGAR